LFYIFFFFSFVLFFFFFKMRFVSVVLTTALFFAVALASVDHAPYKYTIDLSKGGDMFDHVVKDMCEDEKHITAFLTLYKQLSGKITGENAEVAMGFVKYIFDHSYSDLYEQLEGMATSFGKHCKKYESLMSDITADKLALLQVVYQLAMNNIDDFMACTSVVVADQSDDDNKNGHVYHGRNLDWLNPDLYAPLAT